MKRQSLSPSIREALTDITARTGTPLSAPNEKTGILFFDGKCALCQSGMRFFIRHDHARILRYAPLQGRLGQLLLEEVQLSQKPLDTLIFLQNHTCFFKAEAIYYALRELSGFWGLLALGMRLFPLRLRNFVYDSIAKRRARFSFGQAACPLPSNEEKKWFIHD